MKSKGKIKKPIFKDRCEVEIENIEKRLEELRVELRNERISYAELFELQSLVKYINPNDVELLEAAGIPEDLE